MNWRAAVYGGLAAAVVDLNKFRSTRQADPNAKFDWVLALTNWAIGACAGLGISPLMP